MFFKKLEAKKEEKEKKEPFEKILLRDKTSSGFYFFWDSFQPPSAFFSLVGNKKSILFQYPLS
jgi:hypothetical protein